MNFSQDVLLVLIISIYAASTNTDLNTNTNFLLLLLMILGLNSEFQSMNDRPRCPQQRCCPYNYAWNPRFGMTPDFI